MKKILFLTIIVTFYTGSFFAQQTITVGTPDYSVAKANGTLNNYNVVNPELTPIRPTVSQLSLNRTPTQCFGYTPPNPGVPPHSMGDDSSLPPVSLPFTFCMYGANYNSVYINSNGNVTFGNSNTSFSSNSFPSNSSNPMLAPFWADIDMRGVGNAYYEVFPHAVVVHWVDCGYYSQHVDKKVSVQLIFTDGSSPLLAPGNNVGFFYEDMNWTTGDASGGLNGFGGTPMTVGVDNGDNTNGFQLGRFDTSGMSYDGPFGANDGIDWLDNKSFMFNVCNSSNIPPVINGIQVCDTLRVCLGDSLPINFDVLAVEQNQTSGAFIDTTGVFGYTEISYTPGVAGANGNPAHLSGFFRSLVVDTFTLGINYFDNGIPLDTLSMDLVIIIDTLPYNPILISDTTLCIGQTVEIGAGNSFDTYYWTDTNNVFLGADSSELMPVGWNYLEVTINGCVDHDSVYVDHFADFTPVFSGDTVYCFPDSSVITVDSSAYTSMTWTMNQGVDTLSHNDTITLGNGIYNLAISDTNGCTFNNNVLITEFQSFVSINGATTYCEGDSVLLNAPIGFDSYAWKDEMTGNGISTVDSAYATSGTTTLIVSGLGGCFAYDTIAIAEIVVPTPVITGQHQICPPYHSITYQSTLTFNNTVYTNYEWLLGNSTPTTPSVNVSAGIYYVAVDYQGCLDTSAAFTVVQSVEEPMNMIYSNKVCENSSVLLESGTTYSSYTWSTGATTNSISVTQGGAYTLNVVDANGCLNDTTINVVLYNGVPDISAQPTACLGDQIALSNATVPDGGGVWSYNGPGVLSFSPNASFPYPSVSVDEAGTYEIVFTHNECPELTDTLTIAYSDLPILSLLTGDSITLCNGESMLVQATTSDPTNTVWESTTVGVLGIGDSINVTQEGDYTVSLNNYCGLLSADFYVTVIDCKIPNIITPNNDGENDVFKTDLIDSYSDVVFTVYNRWGRKVYEKSSYDNSWSGTSNSGAKLHEGTYFYVIAYDNGNGSKKGTITIFR